MARIANVPQVEMVRVDDLKPHPKNPRLHPESAMAALVQSIQRFGWTNPVLVDAEGYILAGHARVMAAKRLGLQEVPVIRLPLSGPAAEAYLVADNRITELGQWDEGLLAELFAELEQHGVDLAWTGFEEAELERIFAEFEAQAETNEAGGGWELSGDEDEPAPEPPAEPVTRPGDLWILGRHRLLCGDATNPEHVHRLLDGAKPTIMVTDPPYGVDYQPAWRNEAFQDGAERRTGTVVNDSRADWYEAWALFPGDVVYCWHAHRYASTVQASLERAGFEVRAQIIWAKPRLVVSRGHYHWQHEPCWYAVRKGATAHWIGDRSQTTLWEIPMLDDEDQKVHGTQKPTECMARPIRNHEGDVYDPFVGTGTTIVAAERLGRRCYAMDIDPRYCDVAVQRWERLTGQKAVRVPAGGDAR